MNDEGTKRLIADYVHNFSAYLSVAESDKASFADRILCMIHEEREACARAVETVVTPYQIDHSRAILAAAVRARSEPPAQSADLPCGRFVDAFGLRFTCPGKRQPHQTCSLCDWCWEKRFDERATNPSKMAAITDVEFLEKYRTAFDRSEVPAPVLLKPKPEWPKREWRTISETNWQLVEGDKLIASIYCDTMRLDYAVVMAAGGFRWFRSRAEAAWYAEKESQKTGLLAGPV